MKRTPFWVLVLEGVIGFHRKSQFQLLQHQWLEHRLGLLWFEWFALEMNWDPSVIFEIAPKYCISDSFVDYKDYSISSTGFFFFFPYGILVHNSRSNHHLNWMKTLSLLKTVLFSLSRFHVCFFVSTYHIFYFSVYVLSSSRRMKLPWRQGCACFDHCYIHSIYCSTWHIVGISIC